MTQHLATVLTAPATVTTATATLTTAHYPLPGLMWLCLIFGEHLSKFYQVLSAFFLGQIREVWLEFFLLKLNSFNLQRAYINLLAKEPTCTGL